MTRANGALTPFAGGSAGGWCWGGQRERWGFDGGEDGLLVRSEGDDDHGAGFAFGEAAFVLDRGDEGFGQVVEDFLLHCLGPVCLLGDEDL